MYADDSQLYKSMSPNIEEDQLTAVMQLQNCIWDKWLDEQEEVKN